MARVTPEQYQEKHARRLKDAAKDIERGVGNVTEAPGKAAAAKADKMRANITEAIDSGKWGDRVASVPLNEWQDKMIKKGIPRISAGIDQAKEKQIEFAGQLLPYVDAGRKNIKAMPDLTIEDSKARAAAWIDHMAGFRRK